MKKISLNWSDISSSIRIVNLSIFLWRYFKGSHQYMVLRCSFKKLIKTLYNILPLCHLLSFLHQGFLQKNSPSGKGGKDQNGRWIGGVQTICQWQIKNRLPVTLPRRSNHLMKIKLEDLHVLWLYEKKIKIKIYN